MKLNTYLDFEGNCEEVINSYPDVLGGEIKMMVRFNEAPPNAFTAEKSCKDKIMHAILEFGDCNLNKNLLLEIYMVSPLL